MPFPLKITTYDPGASGAPTTTNPRDLSGWAETYDDSLLNELGCESARITGRVASIEAAVEKGIRRAAPQLVNASVNKVLADKRRDPNMLRK